MPFFMPTKLKIKKDCVSLQVHKLKIGLSKNSLYYVWKRVCLFISRKNIRRGSVSIEASIVITIFIMLVMFVQSFMIMVNTKMSIQIKVNNIAQHTAKKMFYIDVVNETSEKEQTLKSIKTKIKEVLNDNSTANINMEELLTKGMEKGYFATQLLKESSEESLISQDYILGGMAGINILDSSLKNGFVDFVVKYKIKVPFINKSFPICQRARVKDWTGVDIAKNSDKVYITKTGEVYHCSDNCSHLALHISKTTVDQIKSLRNANGGKYSACLYCAKKSISQECEVFIAEDGDKYHTSLQCSGITRNIIEIDISQIGNRRPCSKCGNQK